jgi:DNA-binding transcriptional LysR family regulator
VGAVEVRELQHFVAVAEELHHRPAAERLAMAQPPQSTSRPLAALVRTATRL